MGPDERHPQVDRHERDRDRVLAVPRSTRRCSRPGCSPAASGFSLRLLWKAAPGGLLLSGDVLLFFTAVKLTNVVNATTIGALQPLVIAVFATQPVR